MESGKKSGRNLNEEEIVGINQIVIRCAIQMQKLSNLSPEACSKIIIKMVKSEKSTAIALLSPNLPYMKSTHLYSPAEINKNLGSIDTLLEESLKIRFISESQLSKALSGLVAKGLLINIKGKKELKRFLLDSNKVGTKLTLGDIDGRISLYLTSSKVEYLKKLIADDKIRNLIYLSLKKYGLLQKYLILIFKAYRSAAADEKVFQFLMTLNRRLKMNKSDWDRGRKIHLSLDDKAIESIANRFVEFMPELEKEGILVPGNYLSP
jgi:hypothetical protein